MKRGTVPVRRATWAGRALDLAIGAGSALLGCALLAATALHVLDSVDVSPSIAVTATPRAFVARQLPRVVRAKPAPRRRLRPNVRSRVAVASVPKRRVASKSQPAMHGRKAARVWVALTPRVFRPRVLPRSRPSNANRRAASRVATLPEAPLGFDVAPSLVRVAVASPPAARLEGLRLRGRLIVPTAAPSAPPWPASRGGLSPGP